MQKKEKMSNDKKSDADFEAHARPSIKLYMIRHAESKNNEIYRDARHTFKGGTSNFDRQGWIDYINTKRSADPAISSTGVKQADALAEYMTEHLRNQASCPVRFVVSPMRRTIETILPTLRGLTVGGGNGDDGRTDVDITMNALYFESEGCHLRGKKQPGMNQFEIRDILSSAAEAEAEASTEIASSNSGLLNPSFVGFDEDPNLGWYNYGVGPEHRYQSEERASAFYTWLCEYLDEQLMQPPTSKKTEKSNHHDVYDASVTIQGEEHEICHDKMSNKYRKRRTVVLVGHGDFMSLCLKRMIAAFGHSVEHHNVSHRTAFIHYNTGITELEYFGKGRFLVMQTNNTVHLNSKEKMHLKTGGSLKDGWSFLMPSDDVLLYEEGVSSAFEDELNGHVKEQVDALQNLYISTRYSGSFLQRKDSCSLVDDGGECDGYNDTNSKMTFFIKRGLQVVGCISYDDQKNLISDLVVRPSARDGGLEKDLLNAVIAHAKKKGKDEIYVSSTDANEEAKEGAQRLYKELGFTSNTTSQCDEQLSDSLIMKLSI